MAAIIEGETVFVSIEKNFLGIPIKISAVHMGLKHLFVLFITNQSSDKSSCCEIWNG